MTIENNGVRRSYVASASQTVFVYPFRIFDATDLLVYKNGILLAYTVDYNVTGVNDQTGGTVVLTTGAAANDIILLIRSVPVTRTTDYQNGNRFDADELDNEGDRIFAILQQITDNNITIRYDQDDNVEYPGDVIVPILGPNQFWQKSADGTAFVASDITPDPGASQLRSELASSAPTLGANLVNTERNITVQSILSNLNTIYTANDGYQILVSDFAKTILVDITVSSKTITLPSYASIPDGYWIEINATGLNANFLRVNGSGSNLIYLYGDHFLIGANKTIRFMKDPINSGYWIVNYNEYNRIGEQVMLPYSMANGEYWVEDGSALSREFYNVLFSKIGTTFGAGDGSTTFNIPNSLGRFQLGSGKSIKSFIFTANAVTNELTFSDSSGDLSIYTGTQITLTTTGTLPAPLAIGTTYHVIKVSSTQVKLATHTYNATLGVDIDITTAGTGIHTMHITGTDFALASFGGEESHAINEIEQTYHRHSITATLGSETPGYTASGAGDNFNVPAFSDYQGDSVPHNNIPPYIVKYPMIKLF
jgi:microcystin-dependent protein